MQTLKKRTQGFTIIEVMIVLVIAAVILLIVFLAIPALQRNSRNTQRKNDVAAILAATAEYATNNNGSYPSDQATFNSQVLGNAKLGFYTTAEVTYATTGTPSAPADNATNVTVWKATKCNGNTPTKIGATERQIAATYNVEASAGLTVEQCQEG